MSKFKLYTDERNDHRWKLLSGTDTVLARSDRGFRSKEDCIESVETLKREVVSAATDPVVQAAQPGNAPSPGAAPSPSSPKQNPPAAH